MGVVVDIYRNNWSLQAQNYERTMHEKIRETNQKNFEDEF